MKQKEILIQTFGQLQRQPTDKNSKTSIKTVKAKRVIKPLPFPADEASEEETEFFC